MINQNEKRSKICSYCKQEKQFDLFYKNKSKPDGLGNICKSCALISRRKSKSGGKTKLMRSFKLTLDQYDNISTAQNGTCAICSNPETSKYKGTTRYLAVDHCHKTGIVRGLLCFSCNIALGKFKDNINNLTKAIAYLKKTN